MKVPLVLGRPMVAVAGFDEILGYFVLGEGFGKALGGLLVLVDTEDANIVVVGDGFHMLDWLGGAFNLDGGSEFLHFRKG